MLSWFSNKGGGGDAPTSPTEPRAAEPGAATNAAAGDLRAAAAATSDREALAQLQSAQGDDAALLRLAKATPVLEHKIAAVDALVSEDALRQAEREFRNHHRSVHRVAKQRLDLAVARRHARARAEALIEAAAALGGEAVVPVNHLVALDNDWQAIDASLLDEAQRERFGALRDGLAGTVRERAEQLQHQQRWSADAKAALAVLHRALAQAVSDGVAHDLGAPIDTVRTLHEARPASIDNPVLDQTLQTALDAAHQVVERLAWLDALDDRVGEAPASADPDLAPTPVASASERWHALPALADAELARLLDQRFERRLRALALARAEAMLPKPAAAAHDAAVSGAVRVASAATLRQFDALLQEAETALAEGQLGVLQQHLQAIDALAESMHGVTLSPQRRARRQALHAEQARLKGWQRWGGSRARDDLLAEAEVLAQRTQAASQPDAPKSARLHLKEHGDAIQALRVRWKELDRLGAAASQAMWQRFDAALTAAHEPVAAQQAALKAAREDNLRQREALLAALDALPDLSGKVGPDTVQDPDGEQSPPGGDPGASGTTSPDGPARWRDCLRELDRFHTAWRQLGPLEHTVPAAARKTLQQRLRRSLERLETPLDEARRAAEAERCELIARAEALAQEFGQRPNPRDAVPRVRELQARWQQHARRLPLARGVESALWARFKAATDAVFAQRAAAIGAQEAEFAAKVASREALLERLVALPEGATTAEIERTLAEVDRAWRQGVDLPRAALDALDARYRRAREGAQRRLADSAQARWQGQCDTLCAELALCEERERTDGDGDELGGRWQALEALPAAWDQALAQRWSRGRAEPGPLSAAALDEVLLQLEVALDLPATAEQQAARHQLKLRALKQALEGRRSTQPEPMRPREAFAAALRQADATPAQRARLLAVIAALRRTSPDDLRRRAQFAQ